MEINVPYLSNSALRHAAAQFLSEYHASSEIPVPIEEIVDFYLGIEIVPIPGIHRAYDIDSMLSRDLRQICVDAGVFGDRPGRYRFSLAHEVGHRQLHAEVYNQLEFTNIAGWKQAVSDSLEEKDYGRIEYQAYAFAGLVLVPPQPLANRFQAALDLAQSKGLTINIESEVTRNVIEGYLSKEFVVSREVIQRRMNSDQLWK